MIKLTSLLCQAEGISSLSSLLRNLEGEDGTVGLDEDEGYRTLSFAEMQDPKVLQQPLPLIEAEKPAETASKSLAVDSHISETTGKLAEEVTAQHEGEMTS